MRDVWIDTTIDISAEEILAALRILPAEALARVLPHIEKFCRILEAVPLDDRTDTSVLFSGPNGREFMDGLLETLSTCRHFAGRAPGLLAPAILAKLEKAESNLAHGLKAMRGPVPPEPGGGAEG